MSQLHKEQPAFSKTQSYFDSRARPAWNKSINTQTQQSLTKTSKYLHHHTDSLSTPATLNLQQDATPWLQEADHR